jgi:deoxyribonuclease-4
MTEKILIGPAGTGGAEIENFEKIKDLGLDAVELEFTYSVWMSKEQAQKIAEENKKLNLRLSIHASYFINLNSTENQKIEASRARILKSCEMGHYLAGNSKEKTPIVFHAGFYQKDSKELAYEHIKNEMLKIQEIISEKKWNALLCPETTGKASQFGDLDELIQLIKDTKCSICIDFSHLKARYNGKIDYDEIMSKIKKLKTKIHCHFSGIEYTAKGERRHLLTETKDINELFNYLKKYDISATIINESPKPLDDAIKMNRLLGGNNA